jgi:frataxin-like iron-binding protein CyaY
MSEISREEIFKALEFFRQAYPHAFDKELFAIRDLIESSDKGPEVDAYEHGIIMTIRHWDEMQKAWMDYRGSQNLGEFANEYLMPFRDAE